MSRILKIDCKIFHINRLAFLMYLLIGIPFTFLPFFVIYMVNILFDTLQAGDKNIYYLSLAVFTLLNIAHIASIKYSALFDARVTFDVGKRLRMNLVVRVLKSKNIKLSSVGGFIDILEDDVSPIEYLLLTHIDFIEQVLYLIMTIFILCKINVIVTITIVIPFILISLGVQYLGDKYKDKYSESRENSIEFSSTISDLIRNRESIQYFADDESIKKVIREKCYLRGKSRYKRNVHDKTIDNTIKSLEHICLAFLMLISTKILLDRNLSIGDFILYSSYIGFGCSYLFLLKNTVYGVKSVLNSIDRIAEITGLECFESDSIMFSPIEIKENIKSNNSLGDLVFSDFKMCQEDQVHSFVIEKNDLVVVTGCNGSGKTKFIHCLLGYASYEGKITMNGKPLDLPGTLGYSSQQIHFFDASAKDNVILFSREESCIDSLVLANMDTEIEEWKMNSTNETIGVNGKRLSEGQRQRLSIARAIHNGSSIFIFDDVFAFIDKKNRKEIFEKIKKLEGIKIFVTNDQNIIQCADDFIHLEEERIHWRGGAK